MALLVSAALANEMPACDCALTHSPASPPASRPVSGDSGLWAAIVIPTAAAVIVLLVLAFVICACRKMKRAVRTHEAGESFYFLHAEELRSGRLSELPVFSEATQRGLLTKKRIEVQGACVGEYASKYLAISHRWEMRNAPDSQNEQCQILNR